MSVFNLYNGIEQELHFLLLKRGMMLIVFHLYHRMKEHELERTFTEENIKKSIRAVHSHQLLLRGQYGIANTLLRQIYEYLLVGKYFYKKQNEALAEKWLDNKGFDVYDKALRLLKLPAKGPLCEFWKMLCNIAHASTCSVQVTLDGEFNQFDIKLSYNIVLILLCCKHYLVNCFYSNRKLIRFIKIVPIIYKELVELRKESIRLVNEIALQFSDEGIKVLKDYRRYWVFKK